jgi:very-short-patch-repair endonuclease
MPTKRATPQGYAHARELRKILTPAESKLWAYLRHDRFQEVSFRRQHAIGPYVVDFCAVKLKLVIELDGSQHLDQEGYDAVRSEYLQSVGYHVIRFWNNDVMNDIQGVIAKIMLELNL